MPTRRSGSDDHLRRWTHTRQSVGSAECPTKTIREALALVTADVSPFTEASILTVLGMVLIDQRRDAEAADALQRALDIRAVRLKPDHPDVVVTRDELDAVRQRLSRK